MNLIFSTVDFKIQGIGYPSFPILISKDNDIFLEGLHFLIYHCLKRGKVQSQNSWETYGRDLFDYFSFIEANKFNWKEVRCRTDSMLLALYRNFSFYDCNLKASTVNRRLRLVIKFYDYSYSKGFIDNLPYKMEEVLTRQSKQFLAHTDTSGGLKTRPDVLLTQPTTKIKVLNSEQISELLEACKSNITLYLMVLLGLSTGLRKQEILTLPLHYITNPKSTSARSHIVVYLDSSEMSTKGNKQRSDLSTLYRTLNYATNLISS
jgi:integrase/recombinase XerD